MNAKILSWLSCFAMLFFMEACEIEKNLDFGGPDGVTLTVSTETLTFDPEGGEQVITFETNAPEKVTTYAENSTWCTASEDLINNKVTISVIPNIGKAARVTGYTFHAGSQKKVVYITQNAVQTEIQGVYKVNLPENALAFSESKIYKVMDGSQKVAEICLEYLKNATVDSRAVVVYVGEDYTNGFVAYLVDADGNPTGNGGGTANFDKAQNTLAYTGGTGDPVMTVYISGDGATQEELGGAADKTPEPYTVEDASGNNYPVVKVGADVWLGSNLRTLKYGDLNRTEIPYVEHADLPGYSAQGIPFATYPGNDPSVNPEEYGYLYSARSIWSKDEDPHCGWMDACIVSETWRVATGGGSNSTGINGITTDWQRLFKYVGENGLYALLAKGYNWRNGAAAAGAFDPTKVTNITGLAIPPAGQILSGGSDSFYFGGQAFFIYRDDSGSGGGYNFAEVDGKAPDQQGVRYWGHSADKCSIRMVRKDD
jgi:hypothetical protein